MYIMIITPDLPFLNIHNLFTNERISVYLDKYSRMFLDTKDYFVNQISHLSKGVVITFSVLCRFKRHCHRKKWDMRLIELMCKVWYSSVCWRYLMCLNGVKSVVSWTWVSRINPLWTNLPLLKCVKWLRGLGLCLLWIWPKTMLP